MENELILRVNDLARGGAGVAKDAEGRVIFIPFSAPGDLVRVQIVEIHKNYAHAEILEILEPSADRQAPPCPIFGKCGGCQWQHLPYAIQWDTKVKGVLQALRRANLEVPSSPELIPSDEIWYYRNRVQLRGMGKELGFFQAGSRQLVPTDKCYIARPEINENWEETREEGSKLSQPYKVELEVLPGGRVRKVWNSPHSAEGFRQVHDGQNEKLKNWVAAVLPDNDVLYDLFGGSGNLSLPLVNQSREIHCVDLSTPLVRPSDIPKHLQFHRASVDRWLSHRVAALKLRKVSPRGSISAIVDPPRAGLKTQLPVIASAVESLGVKRLVAVGCDPDSWARDLSQWVKRGWRLEKVMLIDLFPQTSHIESVAFIVSDRDL
ncbi:MAG: TRAM domain-containing protein [Bdellovibrionia bacterium]